MKRPNPKWPSYKDKIGIYDIKMRKRGSDLEITISRSGNVVVPKTTGENCGTVETTETKNRLLGKAR